MASFNNEPKQGRRASIAGCRVIVIEDEALQAFLIAKCLTELGAEAIDIATSIPAALMKLSSRSYDIVCLDGNMNGVLTVGMARGLKNRNIPVVFCTAYHSTMAQFVNGPIVQKPIEKEALEHALSVAFELC